jgi:hypothetical protein
MIAERVRDTVYRGGAGQEQTRQDDDDDDKGKQELDTRGDAGTRNTTTTQAGPQAGNNTQDHREAHMRQKTQNEHLLMD